MKLYTRPVERCDNRETKHDANPTSGYVGLSFLNPYGVTLSWVAQVHKLNQFSCRVSETSFIPTGMWSAIRHGKNKDPDRAVNNSTISDIHRDHLYWSVNDWKLAIFSDSIEVSQLKITKCQTNNIRNIKEITVSHQNLSESTRSDTERPEPKALHWKERAKMLK